MQGPGNQGTNEDLVVLFSGERTDLCGQFVRDR
jgi:hypothetical protein